MSEKDLAIRVARNLGREDREGEVQYLRSEIKRLRIQCGGNCRYWEGRWRNEKAEVERLRAALRYCDTMRRSTTVIHREVRRALEEQSKAPLTQDK